jgi:methylenetetrahydrofolate reductase (NADPH)
MRNIELSVEFFPPQTPEGVDKLRATWTKLAVLEPAFFSVTFGAGGSTRERTFDTVAEMRAAGLPAAPHISCIGSTRDNVRQVLERYKAAGIRRTVALRGDLPSGMADPGEFRHANELVEFIRQETGDWFTISVAAYPEMHPQADNPRQDLLNFKRKVDAGADSAITQFFFNADAYEHFLAEAQSVGIFVPIIPGIMPIASYSKLSRFAEGCGAEIPRWMRKAFEGLGDDAESIRAFGLDVVTQLCERLIKAGAPGLHFYTLNQAGLTTEIVRRLGL